MKITILPAIVSSLLLVLPIKPSHAGSANWSIAPSNGDWNTPSNWSPATVPNGPSDTAGFSNSSLTTVSISANTEVNGITFNANSSAYSITAKAAFTLTISDVGISNSSGTMQNFLTGAAANGAKGLILFGGSANAGASVKFTNRAGLVSGVSGGETRFTGNATGGSATFINDGAAIEGALGGATEFFDTSSAGNGSFAVNGGAAAIAPGGINGGKTSFRDMSNAGNASFTINAGTISGASGGLVQFLDSADANYGIFTVNGSASSDAGGGRLHFVEDSTAGHATLIANGGFNGGLGGTILFAYGSTGVNARVELFGNGVLDLQYADTLLIGSLEGDGIVFLASSTLVVAGINDTIFSGVIKDWQDGTHQGNLVLASSGTLTLTGLNTYTGRTEIDFGTLALAGGGSIANTAEFEVFWGATLSFGDSTTPGSRPVTNIGGYVIGGDAGTVDFVNTSTAGTANFHNQGGADNGAIGANIYFLDSSTAGNAVLQNEGGRATDATGGYIRFFGGSTAANANLTNDGGFTGGAFGGVTHFFGASSAGNSTLTNKGGLSGSGGGSTFFFDHSTGGTTRVKVLGNGSLHISGHDTPGLAIGSIEGDGDVYLGTNSLTVGANNMTTSFAGLIDGEVGSSLAKTGSGTLTLGGGTSNNHLGDGIMLKVVDGFPINLAYSGDPDRVEALLINNVPQLPGTYGGSASGAANQIAQFSGTGQVLVTGPIVLSRKLQGASAFDTYLPVGGAPGVECRSGGANSDYKVVFNFLNPVTFNGAQVTFGQGMILSATGNGTTTITVDLTGVTNAQTITITLFNVNDGMNTADLPVEMAVLVGDSTGNGVVNASDVSQVKLQSGHAINISNYREDISGNGAINSSDVSLVKSRSGTGLPPSSSGARKQPVPTPK